MKKLFIILSAVLTLAACSKSELAEINEPKQEEAVSTPVTFNVTVNEAGTTKALKSDWANGDIIYVKFKGIDTKFLTLTYNGSTWVAQGYDNASTPATTTFEVSDFSGIDAGDMKLGAVHFPVAVDANINSNNLQFKSGGANVNTYYMSQEEAAYTFNGTNVNITLSLQKPDRVALFHINGLQANAGDYALKISGASTTTYLPYCEKINANGTLSKGASGTGHDAAAGIPDADGAIFTLELSSGFDSEKELTFTVTGPGVQEYSISGTMTLVAGKQYSLPALDNANWTTKFKPFTINGSGGRVYIAPGNLQATYYSAYSSWVWSFAANQWDYIGNAEGNTKVTSSSPFVSGYSGTYTTVDLFGWVGATSIWSDVNKYGITSETTLSSADTYGINANDALKSDWGNTIGNGWHTLRSEEWAYLFDTRSSGSTVNSTSNARYTYATINTDGTSVNGMILFPDGVTIANGEATEWGNVNNISEWGTKCTSAQWTALAAKGCVFLPAAGYRNAAAGGAVYSVGDYGMYWSSSPYSANKACFVSFDIEHLITQGNNYRYYGYSVRLVHDVE